MGIGHLHGGIVGGVERVVVGVEHLHVLVQTGVLHLIAACSVGRSEDKILVLLGGAEAVLGVGDAGLEQYIGGSEAGAELVEVGELCIVLQNATHALLWGLNHTVHTVSMAVGFGVVHLDAGWGQLGVGIHLGACSHGGAHAVAAHVDLTAVLGLVVMVPADGLAVGQQQGVIVQNVDQLAGVLGRGGRVVAHGLYHVSAHFARRRVVAVHVAAQFGGPALGIGDELVEAQGAGIGVLERGGVDVIMAESLVVGQEETVGGAHGQQVILEVHPQHLAVLNGPVHHIHVWIRRRGGQYGPVFIGGNHLVGHINDTVVGYLDVVFVARPAQQTG